MEQNYLNWEKTFGIDRNDIILDFIVQSHKVGYFLGTVIYFRENKNRQNHLTEPAFILVTKTFGDETEVGIFTQLKDWLVNEYHIDNCEFIEKSKTQLIS